MPTQLKNNLFAAWKLLLSFRKHDWELRDYPVVVRAQNTAADLDRTSSRCKPYKYVASILNWALVGGGDTPGDALEELRANLQKVAEDRRRAGVLLPRPGTKVAIEFAAQEQIHAHRDLVDDFVRRVLGLEWAWISDESSLWDFHTSETNDDLQAKIKEVYGVDVSDIESGNLAQILERITAMRS